MEPIISYSGLEISLIEIILGLALLLLGALAAYILKPSGDERLHSSIFDMAQQQAQLQGRLSQFANDSAQRDTLFRESLDERLAKVSERVGKSIVDTQERSSESLKHLHERLALIDRAQKNIEMLSTEVSGLQSLLSNKQSRGAFGEIQMQDIIKTLMPPNAYAFQHTLSNGKRVDAIIKMPDGYGDVAIDSKFPMEAWKRLIEAENSPAEPAAKREFSRDLLIHIKAISEKYIIFGETHEVALMFLPSEAIYAEIHARFENVIKKGFMEKVVIVSPSTFMATLHTMRAVMKDAAMREQAHIIQHEVGLLSEDVTRLDERVEKLQSHFSQSTEDIRKIRISTDKITKRAGKIEDLELKEKAIEDTNVTPIRRVD
ncbi:DNA recombination protein RmuC [Robiginitomaculum antarcticum]|uniref:DNA recombination protein RmuC n=1 Tax=Robiginitomaculum antarcticum TaxID=437507 RepID=UPI00037341A3|nr:DNA recombination protein RmuC [Robiginitomaculum antarcticum]